MSKRKASGKTTSPWKGIEEHVQLCSRSSPRKQRNCHGDCLVLSLLKALRRFLVSICVCIRGGLLQHSPSKSTRLDRSPAIDKTLVTAQRNKLTLVSINRRSPKPPEGNKRPGGYSRQYGLLFYLFIFQAVKDNLGRAVKDISLTVEFECNEMVVEPSYEEGWEIFPRYHPIVSRCRLYTIN